MGNIFNRPVIGVVMCRNRVHGHLTQTLQEKYLNAVLNAGGLPVALPHALSEPELLESLLPHLDGIMLPGSPSNVQPHLYGENGDEPDADPGRDSLSMALISIALERRIPLFAICRGLQEMVARSIAASMNSRSYWSTAKIQSFRWSNNMPPLMKCWYRQGVCFHN